jgi:dnd system-associated protein 4
MGSDCLIKLIVINQTKNLRTLSVSEQEHGIERNLIFEEYANGGLEILQAELRGSVDSSERILLMLNSERFDNPGAKEEFDLTKFLS